MNGKSKLFDNPELSGFIDSLDFKVNGRQVQWNLLPGQPDICRIDLYEPLKAGDTILITTPFRVKIPKGVTSRLAISANPIKFRSGIPNRQFMIRMAGIQCRISIGVNFTLNLVVSM